MTKPIERLQHALLETGMMNQRFIDMIMTGEVTKEYVAEALSNFRQALYPKKPEVESKYVLGVMLDEDESRVLVIWKNRPAWQFGKLNCVGGKIEEGETPLQAMQREFDEETAFHEISFASIMPTWKYVGKRYREALVPRQPGSYEMHIFISHYDTRVNENLTADEPVFSIPMNLEVLHRRGVPGLAWVVDAARCAAKENFMIDVQDPIIHLDDDE